MLCNSRGTLFTLQKGVHVERRKELFCPRIALLLLAFPFSLGAELNTVAVPQAEAAPAVSGTANPLALEFFEEVGSCLASAQPWDPEYLIGIPPVMPSCSGDNCGCYDIPCSEECPPEDLRCYRKCVEEQSECASCCCCPECCTDAAYLRIATPGSPR